MVLSKVSAKRDDQQSPIGLSNPSKPRNVKDLHIPAVSPAGGSLEEEVNALKLRNKILTETLKAIKETADVQAKKHRDLVWFAKNRMRYTNHKDRKRIEDQQSDEIEKLKSPDADYHHGMHTGCLAASRMFQQQADILHINNYEQVTDEMIAEAKNHLKKIDSSRTGFPSVSI